MKHLILIIYILLNFHGLLYSQMFNKTYPIEGYLSMAFAELELNSEKDSLYISGICRIPFSGLPTKMVMNSISIDSSFGSSHFFMVDTFKHYIMRRDDIQSEKKLFIGSFGDSSFGGDGGSVAIINNYKELKWLKEYETENGDPIIFLDGKISDNGSIYLLAQKRINNNPDCTRVIKTDSLGEVLWHKDYFEENFKYIPKTFTKYSDSISLIGMSKSPVTNLDSFTIQTKILFIDDNGELISSWENENERTTRPDIILILDDGGLIYASRILNKVVDGVAVWNGYICRLNSNFDKVWEKEIGNNTVQTRIHKVIPTIDGNFVGVGTMVDSVPPNINYHRVAWVFKFDMDGNILWERRPYGALNEIGFEQNILYDIIELEDGSLIACGEVQDPTLDSYTQQGWLLRMTAQGLVDTSVLVSIPEVLAPPNEVKLFPNPTSNQLNIQTEVPINQIDIHNVSGKIIHSQTIQNRETQIDVSTWPSGIYFVWFDKKWVKRFVVE